MSGTMKGDGVVSLKVISTLLSALDSRNADDPLNFDWTQFFANGTGASQISQQWYDQRTLAASTSENLDLAGSLTNAFGATITFTKIKIFAVKASSANTNDVQVARAAANGLVLFLALSDAIVLHPGDVFLYMGPTGATVTAGTGDIITVTNGAAGTPVTYDICLIGVD